MKFKISHTSPFPSNLVNIYTEYYDQTENFKIAFIDKSMQIDNLYVGTLPQIEFIYLLDRQKELYQ